MITYAENEVCLVGDIFETWGHGPSQRKVEEPIRARTQTDGLGSHFHREYFRRIGPANGSHRDSKRADKEVGADNDPIGCRLVIINHPNPIGTVHSPMPEPALKSAEKHEEEAHERCTGK